MHIVASPTVNLAVLDGLAIVAAALLLTGLWTPLSASLVAAVGLWSGLASRDEPSKTLLLMAIGVALVMLGPGAWSVDARLYGWRRIDVRDPRSDRP
jgi:uncharacterized membrane protein YphA (DoxX/SURF4 family)